MLVHTHSGLRWIVLLLLLVAIGNALVKDVNKKEFKPLDRKLGLFSMISVHLQLVLGLILYFISPKVQFTAAAMEDKLLRFYTVEHITLMLLAIAVITVGYSRAKRVNVDTRKFRSTWLYYLIGLVLILISIPWPWQDYGAGWG